ncbi:MAG: hypothetical protein IPO98_21915 [Saprospiraceae bacterium]|nr:hypothetical protein [Saprospiraceae bacterium]
MTVGPTGTPDGLKLAPVTPVPDQVNMPLAGVVADVIVAVSVTLTCPA